MKDEGSEVGLSEKADMATCIHNSLNECQNLEQYANKEGIRKESVSFNTENRRDYEENKREMQCYRQVLMS